MGIALPALDIKAPQPDSPLVPLSQLARLKTEQGQQELQQSALKNQDLERQSTEEQLGATHAMNEAYKNAVKVDPSGVPSIDTQELTKSLAQAGHGSKIPEILKSVADYQKQQADLTEAKQKIDTSSRDSAGAAAYAVKQAGYDAGLADMFLAHQLQAPGTDPQHAQMLQQARDMIKADPTKVKGIIDPLIAQSPQYSAISTAADNSANSAKELELRNKEFKAKLPGGQLEDVSKTALYDYLHTPQIPNERIPMEKRNAATYEAWKAKQSPLAQINVAAAAGGGMTDAATDQAAEMYHATGKLPPTSRGVAGLAQSRKIMNRAAELYPGSLAEGTADYAANKKSLEKLQGNLDQVSAFEKTAVANAKLLDDVSKQIPDLGAKFLNVPIRMITGSMIGTEKMSRFDVLRTTTLPEFAKMVVSANANGVLTDDARKTIQDKIGPNATYNSIKGAIQAFEDEAENRRTNYQAQVDDIKKRLNLSGKKEEDEKPAPKQDDGKVDWSKFPVHK